MKCKPGHHNYEPMRTRSNADGDTIQRERCTTCGDVYPCRHDCAHVDCALETGRPLPDWITVHGSAPGTAPIVEGVS